MIENKEDILCRRYVIESKYDVEKDLLKITIEDRFDRRTREAIIKLNGVDRASMEERLYESLGFTNIVVSRTREKIIRNAYVNPNYDFTCYTNKLKRAA